MSAPANLQILSATGRRVELKWDAVPGMGDDDFYVVYYSENDDDGWWPWEYSKASSVISEADDDYVGDDWFAVGNQFLVIARKGNIRSGDSNTVTIGSITPAAMPLSFGIGNAASWAVGVPGKVEAKANPKMSNTIDVKWNPVDGAAGYTVSLFSSTGNQVGKSLNVDKAITSISYEGFPSAGVSYPKGAYYVGVKAKGGAYTKTSYTVSAFPKNIDFNGNPSFKTMANDKTRTQLTVKMKGAWGDAAVYGYKVTVENDATGMTSFDGQKNQTNTFVIDNLPKGPKYTLTIIPYTGDNGNYEYIEWDGNLFRRSSLKSK